MESNTEIKASEVKLLGVRLKVVSEDLATESDCPENLVDLTATCRQNECVVSITGSESNVCKAGEM